MGPRFCDSTEPFALKSATGEARGCRRSRYGWPEVREQSRLIQQIQAPTLDYEALSGRGRAPMVDPRRKRGCRAKPRLGWKTPRPLAPRRPPAAFASSMANTSNKPNCESVDYTYCPVARREFHYRASVNACLATALDPMVQVCARGSNRFASRAKCEHTCVFGYRPKDVCFDTPLFSGCDREDVNESWWYFEGGRCHLWSFPAGACPSNDSAVFPTAAECASRCAGRATALCGVPRPTACRRNQLRFPFFAHFTEPEGRMRCPARFDRPGRWTPVPGR
ncbi:hypothetical protein HPB50_003597 [Hyalomma asiaticum]|uniref:Uncharacterized protein n=1 Tax=Hyalomma asiaticum TaxID=266040 RepID=A0ACB7T2U9_HYAAI|nr:hypothetical protein HPB50_003597 [Hyalomma asiaticum]